MLGLVFYLSKYIGQQEYQCVWQALIKCTAKTAKFLYENKNKRNSKSCGAESVFNKTAVILYCKNDHLTRGGEWRLQAVRKIFSNSIIDISRSLEARKSKGKTKGEINCRICLDLFG